MSENYKVAGITISENYGQKALNVQLLFVIPPILSKIWKCEENWELSILELLLMSIYFQLFELRLISK
jgi:hypothetical protein